MFIVSVLNFTTHLFQYVFWGSSIAGFRSCGMRRYVAWEVNPDVSKEHVASFFKTSVVIRHEPLERLKSIRSVASQYWQLRIQEHSVTSQTTGVLDYPLWKP